MTPSLLLLAGLALAEDPATAPEPPAEAPATAAEAPAPPAPVLELGPVRSVAEKALIAPGELRVSHCLDVASAPAVDNGSMPTGALQLRVTVRRGKVKLVTATSVDPGLEWLAPCLTRQLAEHTWPVKRGELDVPIELGLPGELDRGGAP